MPFEPINRTLSRKRPCPISPQSSNDIIKKNKLSSSSFIVKGKWCLEKVIGAGSFGTVYSGLHIRTRKPVAVKVESIFTKKEHLKWEFDIYRVLHARKPDQHYHKRNRNKSDYIPHIYFYGLDGVNNQYNALVMDLMGPSLEDLFTLCERHFTSQTILLLADQMIGCLEFLHSKLIVHRDLKPANFVMHSNNQKVYLIDMGMCKQYRHYSLSPLQGEHVAIRDGNKFKGTPRYASINAHKGITLSRRDDMQSLGYVLIYFLNGQLPWQGLNITNEKEKYEKMQQLKQNITPEILCENQHQVFIDYIDYCYKLQYKEQPDYQMLRNGFNKLYQLLYGNMVTVFDWQSRKQNSS